MEQPNEQQISQEAKSVLVELAELRQELAEFRLEMKTNFAEFQLAFDRIDSHLSDTSEILGNANRAFS